MMKNMSFISSLPFAVLIAATIDICLASMTMSEVNKAQVTKLTDIRSLEHTYIDCQQSENKRSFHGLDYAFLGYNVLYGYPLSKGRDPGFTFPIFKADYSAIQFTSDCRYLVPKGVVLIPEVSCVTSFASEVIKTETQFEKSLSISAHVEGGGWGVSFSASAGYKNSVSQIQSGESLFIISQAQCKNYFSKIDIDSPPTLDPRFTDYLKDLEHDDSKAAYMAFFDKYGTHFLKDIDFGARYTHQHKMSIKEYKSAQSSSFSVSVQAGYSGAFSIGGGFNLDSEQRAAASNFQKKVETTTITIGATPPASGDATEWASTVKEDPMPMDFTLHTIEELFTEKFMKDTDIDYQKIGDNIKKYKGEYCERLLGDVSACFKENKEGVTVYSVSVEIGDFPNAESQDPLYVRINGEYGFCGHKFSNRDFRANSIVQLEITCPKDIGLINSALLRLYGNNGLYVVAVSVTDPFPELGREPYQMPVNAWLDDERGDSTTRIAQAVFLYYTTITATDGNPYSKDVSSYSVTIEMKGSRGKCSDSATTSKKVTFLTSNCLAYVGEMWSIKIRSGNPPSGMRIDNVLVQDMWNTDRTIYIFQVHQYLQANEDLEVKPLREEIKETLRNS